MLEPAPTLVLAPLQPGSLPDPASLPRDAAEGGRTRFTAQSGALVPNKGSFICSRANSGADIKIGKGSYEFPLGTHVEVTELTGTGSFAYAVIQQSSTGALTAFTLEVSASAKDAINMDAGGTFVEFSNVLLAEVKTLSGETRLVQRRIGNLSLIYRTINGKFCLWPETTGGYSF